MIHYFTISAVFFTSSSYVLYCYAVCIKAVDDADLRKMLDDVLEIPFKMRESSYLLRDDHLRTHNLIRHDQSVVKIRTCTNERELRRAGLRGTGEGEEGEVGEEGSGGEEGDAGKAGKGKKKAIVTGPSKQKKSATRPP